MTPVITAAAQAAPGRHPARGRAVAAATGSAAWPGRNRVYLWHAGHQNLIRSSTGPPCSALRILVPQRRQGSPARP